eukprot:7379286-Prymnesium_polylepis.1
MSASRSAGGCREGERANPHTHTTRTLARYDAPPQSLPSLTSNIRIYRENPKNALKLSTGKVHPAQTANRRGEREKLTSRTRWRISAAHESQPAQRTHAQIPTPLSA